MVKQTKFRIFIALGLVIVLLIVLISACDAIGIGGGSEPPRKGPAELGAIMTPANGTRMIAGSKVQIQSAHQDNVSRVELYVQAAGQEQPTLLRADAPENGVVLQEWMPEGPGMYTVKVIAYDINNAATESAPIQVEVIDSTAISVVAAAEEQAASQPADQAGELQAPAATPEAVGPEATTLIHTPVATAGETGTNEWRSIAGGTP